MITFEESIRRAKRVFKENEMYMDIEKVTIVRDVIGSLAFYIETDLAISKEKKECLIADLKTKLDKRFSGNIYYDDLKNNDLVKMVIDEIKRLRSEDETDDGVEWFILERAIAKKAWVECRKQEEAIWSYDEATAGRKPKVVTFYSFKGGMGRTTAMASTMFLMAQKGYNVLAIDTDIEAPGLASLFLDESLIRKGTVDFLLEASLSQETDTIDMSSMIYQVTDSTALEGSTGKIFVIPAGVVDQDYLQKLARIDYQDAIPQNMKKQLSRLIEDAVDVIAQTCKIDYVLLDSRAGFHDMGGVITTQIPHGIILFGRDSAQSWAGLKLVLNAISQMQKDRPLVAIVDSICSTEGLQRRERESFTSQAYSTCCDVFYAEDEQQPAPEAEGEAHSPIFIPYEPSLSDNLQLYTDGSVDSEERVKHLREILSKAGYQNIENRIEQWFGE